MVVSGQGEAARRPWWRSPFVAAGMVIAVMASQMIAYLRPSAHSASDYFDAIHSADYVVAYVTWPRSTEWMATVRRAEIGLRSVNGKYHDSALRALVAIEAAFGEDGYREDALSIGGVGQSQVSRELDSLFRGMYGRGEFPDREELERLLPYVAGSNIRHAVRAYWLSHKDDDLAARLEWSRASLETRSKLDTEDAFYAFRMRLALLAIPAVLCYAVWEHKRRRTIWRRPPQLPDRDRALRFVLAFGVMALADSALGWCAYRPLQNSLGNLLILHYGLANVATECLRLGVCLLAFTWCGRRLGLSWADIGWRRIRFGVLVTAAFVGVCACQAGYCFGAAIDHAVYHMVHTVSVVPDPGSMYQVARLDRVLMVMGAAGVAPPFEETVWRGVLGPGLWSWMGARWGIVVAGLMFALIHTFPPTVALSMFGVVCLVLFRETGSLLPGIVVHAVTNLLLIAPTVLR